jgi:H+-translocating NAD(P) transhydrogenase subunit alpha
MKVSVPKESAAGERRVALVPEVVQRMQKDGFEVVLESGAGEHAHYPDAEYEDAGASMGDGWSGQAVAKVAPPSAEEIAKLGEGTVLVGFLQPLTAHDTVKALAGAGVTAFAMEAIPRITRAQSMDALSSQATIGGYRAGLMAAEHLPRFFPMLTTAAGTVRPAKVMVLGAGVAGLQAIATARRLGAIVSAFDVRSAVKEQIESLGAKFLELDMGLEDAEAEGGYARELTDEEQQKQRELLAEEIGKVDAVISTAAVPGRKAPLLIIEDAVRKMKPGSVVVDLAAETGGNCELTEPGETKVEHGVTIIGPVGLPSTMADHASSLYARNVQSLLKVMVDDEGQLKLDFEDEVIKGACITHDGEIVHEGAKEAAGGSAEPDRSSEAGGRAPDQDAGPEAPRR